MKPLYNFLQEQLQINLLQQTHLTVIPPTGGGGGSEKDGNEEYLMRLDTAGAERKPPLPTISLETLLAAAILISKISIIMLIVAFVNSSDNKIFGASARKKYSVL